MKTSKARVLLLIAVLLIIGSGFSDLLADSSQPTRLTTVDAVGSSRPSAGDNCESPYEIVIDASNFPIYLGGETTCGRGNDYQVTCLDEFDGGEDFILRIDMQVTMSLQFILYPNGTNYTGMLISDHCPPDDDCIGTASQYGSNELVLVVPWLEVGVYYLMVDTWPTPDCIPTFDLEIAEVFFDNPGHECGFPLPIDISPAQNPMLLDYLYTCGAGDDYDNTCLGEYDGGEDFILQLNVEQQGTFDIVLDPQGTKYTGMVLDDICPPGHDDCIAMSTKTSGDPHEINNVTLDAGVYYLMVDTWPQPDCIPQFSVFIDGYFNHEIGDNCDLPQLLSVPDELPITVSGQYTWGRGDEYDSTCLDDFDEGEDYVMQIEVSSAVCVDITLEPHGTSGTALALAAECSPWAECIVSSTNSSSGAHGVTGVSLEVGTYYLLVDCTAATGSIDDFDLTFEASSSHPENDDWQYAIPIGNVVDLPFSTVEATFDGPGVCQEAPNIWYCFTASGEGIAEISLCGASYDTKLTVYRSCDLDSVQEILACSDDYCDLQSLTHVPVSAGESYLIEIGGSGGATGEGVLAAYISTYTCGDVNSDMIINISDVVYLIAYIFGGGSAPDPLVAADVDCNAIVNISDAVYMMMRIFGGGPAPCALCK